MSQDFISLLKDRETYPAFEPCLSRALPYREPDGSQSSILIEFSAPSQAPRGPYTCLVSMKGGPFDGVFRSLGADSLQAFILSFHILRGLLDPLGDLVSFGGEDGETGIPGILPAWPSELTKRLEAMAQAEAERYHREEFPRKLAERAERRAADRAAAPDKSAT